MPPQPDCTDQPVYASAAALLAEAISAFLPSDRITVTDWAIANRKIDGALAGDWRADLVPYVIEPQDKATSGEHETLAIVGAGQVAKTVIAENFLLHSIATDPSPFGWYMNSDDGIKSYVRKVINPMLDAHPAIRALQGNRATDDSLVFKRFRGMSVEFLPATPSSLINKVFRRIVADEYDAYDPTFGDPKTKLDVRRTTYGRDSMLMAISHPDLAGGIDIGDWKRGIMSLYADSTRCAWWWPCPECGAFCSPNPGTARHCDLVFPEDAPLDEIPEQTFLACPTNGCLIADRQRETMNRSGLWVGRGETIDEYGAVTGTRIRHSTGGYWIVGAMSPFLLNGIGGLARNLVAAQRNKESESDLRGVKEVIVKQWGIPFQPPKQVGAVEAASLIERAEPYPLRIIPEGVRFITCAADIQPNRFEYLFRGWGENGQSWLIDYGTRPAETATDSQAWFEFIAWLTAAEFPLSDASGRVMRVRAGGYDSAGAPGTTSRAYEAFRYAQKKNLTRRLGVINGRDAWTMLPLKGASRVTAPRLSVIYPDSQRTDRRAAARGQIPLGLFNPNSFKDDLASQLATLDGKAWTIHLPAALKSEAPPHVFYEGLVAEQRAPNGAWSKIPGAARNEPIDLMVMTHVVAHLHGLPRIDWQRPPAWADVWDANPLVGAPALGMPIAATGETPQAPPRPAMIGKPGRIPPDALRALASRMA